MKGYLVWYFKKAGMVLTESEATDVGTIVQKRWTKLSHANPKIWIAWNGRHGREEYINKNYFTTKSVMKGSRTQQKSENWWVETDMVNMVANEIRDCIAANSGLVVVCRMTLTDTAVAPQEGPTYIAEVECDRKDDADKIFKGEIKPQTREVVLLVPKIDREDLTNPVTEEIDLTKYTRKTLDEHDDVYCDTRQCRVCRVKFTKHSEEVRHREARERRENMDAVAMQEVWKCSAAAAIIR